MKISVCLCIRNGEQYMHYLTYIANQLKMYDYDFEYFIYENNSTDHTKDEIKEFSKKFNCKYIVEDLHNNKMHTGISNKRGKHMATIRNKLKKFHGTLTSDYTLLLDCDVIFVPSVIKKLIDSFNPSTAMVSTYCMLWNEDRHYYDSFAFISNDNISYKESGNTCLFKSCKRCIYIRKKENIVLDLLDDDKILQVKSAFGSLSMIKTEIYNKVNWENSICEHHSFCKQVNEYGNIIVNPMIKTMISNHPADYKKMYHVLITGQ